MLATSSSDPPPLGTDELPTAHPKIQTDCKEDILFLQSELRKAGQKAMARDAKLQTKEVEEKLEKWITTLFTLASPNIQINGLPYAQAFEQKIEYEPKDEALQKRVEALTEETNAMLAHVAELRRTVPDRAGRMLEERLRRETECVEVEEWSAGAVGMEVDGVGEDKISTTFPTLTTQYTTLLSLPTQLEKDLSTSLTRLTRAQAAVSHLVDATDGAAEGGGDGAGSASAGASVPTSPMMQQGGAEMDLVTPRRARKGLLKTLQEG
ncbi:hypothetical protein HDV00_011058 [Rhizophlyctis rosea]|nr:hypothetical protein HDV00_011058 [Rhizophlyctis rosea]